MPKILLENTPTGLKPMYDSDFDEKKKLKTGEQYWATIKKARNYRHLKKYWALMKLTFENIPHSKEEELAKHEFQIQSPEDVHFYVKLKTGYVKKRFVGRDGNIGWEPKSIAFDSMSQDEFNDFYDKAVQVCIDLLEADRQLIENELMNFM